MVKFNITINNKDHKFPSRLTVEQWQDVMKFDIESSQNWPRIIAKLFNVHPKDLSDASDFTIELGIGLLVGLLNSRKECKYLDFSKLTFGEWIDLDVWMTSGVASNMGNICTILGETKYSDEALYRIEAFTAYRAYIYRQYAELFGLNFDEDDEVVEEDHRPQSTSVAESWFSIIIGLAGDNLLHIDAITEQPLMKTLNFMAHQKNKTITENFKKYKKQKEYELQRNR